MRKFLLIIMCSFLNMGFLTGCNEERLNNDSEWELSSMFKVSYIDVQGKERGFPFRGIENKVGITDSPLYIGVSQKVLWHFWDDSENLMGKKLKVEGTSKKTGEQITLFESHPLTLAPNLGATTSIPSGIKLNIPGLWKLDIYLDNQYYETLIVEGIETN